MARASIGSTPPLNQLLRRPELLHQASRLSVNANMTADAMPAHHDQPLPHPSLEIIGGDRPSYLPLLKTLGRPYKPFPLVGWNCHVETIFASFYRSVPDVRLRRECLRTKDDGTVALDWVSGDDSRLAPDSPLLILLVCIPFMFCLSLRRGRKWRLKGIFFSTKSTLCATNSKYFTCNW